MVTDNVGPSENNASKSAPSTPEDFGISIKNPVRSPQRAKTATGVTLGLPP